MKVLCLVISLGLPVISNAQRIVPTVAPDLVIIASKLGTIHRIDISRFGESPKIEGATSSILHEINPPNYLTQVKAEVKLRNNGARSIRSVDCEFLLIGGAGPTTTIRGLTIHVEKAIRPGDTVKAGKLIRAEDLSTWRRLQKEHSLSVRTNIVRIEYADGSVWERGPLRITH